MRRTTNSSNTFDKLRDKERGGERGSYPEGRYALWDTVTCSFCLPHGTTVTLVTIKSVQGSLTTTYLTSYSFTTTSQNTFNQ